MAGAAKNFYAAEIAYGALDEVFYIRDRGHYENFRWRK
jgi:hypothetical protein